jgi:hypothetical protein
MRRIHTIRPQNVRMIYIVIWRCLINRGSNNGQAGGSPSIQQVARWKHGPTVKTLGLPKSVARRLCSRFQVRNDFTVYATSTKSIERIFVASVFLKMGQQETCKRRLVAGAGEHWLIE